MAEFAEKTYQTSNKAILIFLNTLDDVKKAAEILVKKKQQVQVLTGTQRGLERDKLAESDPVFARYMPKSKATPSEGTVYLLCTSAGEVGINISGDYLICDLVPVDRMIQRFGRVNRFGKGDASIDIFITKTSETSQEETQTENEAETPEGDSNPDASSSTKKEPQSPFTQACINTLSLLQRLPQKDGIFDASPAALTKLPLSELHSAFNPMPVVPPVDGILFDAWALTSIRKPLPGRPPVTDWLHGIAAWEPPETHIAWREEVGLLRGELLRLYPPEDLLEDYPLKPHELLRDRSSRVFKELKKKNDERSSHSIWLISASGEVDVMGINNLLEKGEQAIEGKILLLPPHIGMLQNGIFTVTADFDEIGEQYDVADQWLNLKGNKHRCRIWDDEEPPSGMRLALTVDTRPNIDDEDDEDAVNRRHYWRWYVYPRSADDDGSRIALHPQCLKHHLGAADKIAANLAAKLNLGITEANAFRFAAKNHDRGKARKVWQRSIGNHAYPNPTLAKSGGKMSPAELSRYRHEFGSLIDIQNEPEFLALTTEEQDLALHLIASHHGRARPHFSANEAFDPENREAIADNLSAEIPRRFARLQRKYGRWGLAYLESLLRAADALASQDRNACSCNIENSGSRKPREPKDEQ
ncbi:MAG: helicase-related protein [Gammaproteobacteria bacterium]